MKQQKWTVQKIPDLTDKVIVVTGGNTGLGFQSVKTFAEHGAEVVLASRSPERGHNAKERILKSVPKAGIRVMLLDLEDLGSVRKFADALHDRYEKIDVLLNNAGIMLAPYGVTKGGFERHMGINHLGHFALTALLMDLLKASPAARVVHVSSKAHRFGQMDFDNLLFNDGKDYSPSQAYGRSKLANLLFAYELQRRLEKAKSTVISVAAHPGIAQTDLARYVKNRMAFRMLMPVFQFFMQDAEHGALPQIRAAVDPTVQGGSFYGPSGMNEWKGHPVLVESSSASHNPVYARRLWEISAALTETEPVP